MRTRLPPASSVFLVLSLLGIVLGAVLRWGGDEPYAANLVWGVTTAIGLVPIAWKVLSGIVHKQAGVDLIAVLAMAGALVLGEYLAGAVIAFMLATGRALEDFADIRAHRELSALLERAPRSAHRYDGSSLSSVPIGDVQPGDHLLVKHGEVVPVDGFLASGNGVFDESALTGESRPVERVAGEQVRSGAVNAGLRRPASRALRPACDPEAAFRARGGGLRVARLRGRSAGAADPGELTYCNGSTFAAFEQDLPSA